MSIKVPTDNYVAAALAYGCLPPTPLADAGRKQEGKAIGDAGEKLRDKAKEVQASKNDKKDCKPDYSLLPKSFMDQVAYVMMAGAAKYLRDNYRKGHTSNQLTAAASRHLKCIESNEDVDPDTTQRLKDAHGEKAPEILHWACVAASALMAIEQIHLGTHKDDRFKKENE
jgi:hypothetical protein